MIIGYFHVFGAIIRPFETNAPLLIDPDAILPVSIPAQRFEPVARQGGEVIERNSRVQNFQPLFALALKALESPDAVAIGESLCPFVSIALDHFGYSIKKYPVRQRYISIVRFLQDWLFRLMKTLAPKII